MGAIQANENNYGSIDDDPQRESSSMAVSRAQLQRSTAASKHSLKQDPAVDSVIDMNVSGRPKIDIDGKVSGNPKITSTTDTSDCTQTDYVSTFDEVSETDSAIVLRHTEDPGWRYKSGSSTKVCTLHAVTFGTQYTRPAIALLKELLEVRYPASTDSANVDDRTPLLGEMAVSFEGTAAGSENKRMFWTILPGARA